MGDVRWKKRDMFAEIKRVLTVPADAQQQASADVEMAQENNNDGQDNNEQEESAFD